MARNTSEETPNVRHSFLNDTLGKHVTSAMQLLRASSSWESLVQAYRGASLLSSAVRFLPHPAAPLLDKIRSEGVPVTMSGDAWSAEKIQEMARRGHTSPPRTMPRSSVTKWQTLPSKVFGWSYHYPKCKIWSFSVCLP